MERIYSNETFGKRLKAAREKLGYTQDKAAELLYVETKTYRNWEQGRTATPIANVTKLCDLLQCDTGYLFGDYDTRTREAADIQAATGLNEKTIGKLPGIADALNEILSTESGTAFLSYALDYIKTPDTEEKVIIRENGDVIAKSSIDYGLLEIQANEAGTTAEKLQKCIDNADEFEKLGTKIPASRIVLRTFIDAMADVIKICRKEHIEAQKRKAIEKAKHPNAYSNDPDNEDLSKSRSIFLSYKEV